MSEIQGLWLFEQMEVDSAERAAKLQTAPSWSELIQFIRHALHGSLLNGTARFGFEESGQNPVELRAVVQFPIGKQLFDWFFNAHTGYRAQYRCGQENGVAENARLVTILRNEIEECKQGEVSARRLNQTFDDLGPITATVKDIVASLDPPLSKVWFCQRLIGRDGGVQHLNVFRTGPKLVFKSECEPWSSLYADESNAWLDVKGAFIGDAGPYQLKDPAIRAHELQCRGTA